MRQQRHLFAVYFHFDGRLHFGFYVNVEVRNHSGRPIHHPRDWFAVLITQSEAAAEHIVGAREGRQCCAPLPAWCRPESVDERLPSSIASPPGHGSRASVLPLRPGGDWRDTGLGHDRWPQQLPPRDPDRAGQRCAESDQGLPEQQAGAGSPRHQRPLSAHAGLQMPQIGLILLVENEMLMRMPIQFMNRSACRR
jgi:hypothetical protein